MAKAFHDSARGWTGFSGRGPQGARGERFVVNTIKALHLMADLVVGAITIAIGGAGGVFVVAGLAGLIGSER